MIACGDCGGPCEGGCERFASIPFGEIGGFLFEPGSSSGLVRFPPEALIHRIVDTVRAHGGLYLVNEVTTGMGRTGAWFGHAGAPGTGKRTWTGSPARSCRRATAGWRART